MIETKHQTSGIMKCPACGSRGGFWSQATYAYPVCSEDCYFELREAEATMNLPVTQRISEIRR